MDDPTTVATEAEEMIAEATAERATFDASRYLVNLNGRGNYLEVKFRLLWLRREHPEALITTEMVAGTLEERYAIFKATVTIPGRGSATGWKQEIQGDFRDFLEKAETGAIGRALAALGYGTQFCDDHDYGGGDYTQRAGGKMNVVDTPVDLARGRRPDPARRDQRADSGRTDTGREYSRGAVGQQAVAPPSQPATERQIRFIASLARESGLDEQELAAWTQELYQCDTSELNRRDAGTLIEALQRRKNEVS